VSALERDLAAPPRPRFALGQVVLGVAVIVACVGLLRRMDLHHVLATLRAADLRYVGVAVLLNIFVNTSARVRRRQTLLAALPHSGGGAGFLELASLVFVGATANKFLPARAGDAITTVHLRRRHDYPVAALVAAQLLEKVLEVLGMCLLAFAVVALRPPSTISRVPFYVLSAAALAGIGLLLAATYRARGGKPVVPAALPEAGLPGRIRHFLQRLDEASRLLGAARIWFRALLWSIVSDLTDVGMIALCIVSVGLNVEPGVWLLVYLAVNAAIAVPITPGQIGVLEAGAVLALSAAGVKRSEALAFALIYHAVHVVPAAVLALPGWSHLEWSGRRRRP
jgi:uncharacterized protein (TIRG00374 family)